jgi:hypothetical protein
VQEIHALEREISGRLTQTPYVLLSSFPGLNVVSVEALRQGDGADRTAG